MRIVLADDSLIFREGEARLLEEAGHEVVGQVSNGDDLIEAVRRLKPDVAVVDIRMPPTHTDEGLRAAETIRAELGQQVGVLILSQYLDPSFALRVATEGPGGLGYMLKDRVSDLDEFTDAVRRVGRGGVVIDPAVVAQLVGRRRVKGPLDELTDREREVLALMAEGHSNIAIAERLFVTERTVEAHTAAIFSKLELQPSAEGHRRVLAVLTYLRAS